MSRVQRAAAALLALALWIAPAWAADEFAAPGDPALEARVQRIAQELRCLVCQNQTIADSNAELAQDLRREVRRMLAQGASEQAVREFMVARYGDFVLYRPPVRTTTVALWAGPFLLLGVGAWVGRRVVLARRRASQPNALTGEEQARLRALLGGSGEPDPR
jgi:cytochrome c-type biogenesis protein CcmH